MTVSTRRRSALLRTVVAQSLGHAWRAIAVASVGVSVLPVAIAADLPVPCTAGACAGGPATWVTSGSATATVTGQSLLVQQQSDRVTLNWREFDVAPDARVRFEQPGSASLAVNRIFQGSPSRIFGALDANGQVYLLNQNGILFGPGSTVNVGGLLASSLDVTPEALERGLAAPVAASRPALVLYTDGNGQPATSGSVRVEPGATITTAEGGQVLIFAPNIVNQGTIRSPGGQTLLAAGSPVYLATSSDPALRGLLVEVTDGGTVTNGSSANAGTDRVEALAGQIIAERGNVSLAGFAVNQLGRVSASTSVRQNGSVRLIARDGGAASGGQLQAGTGGQLVVGANSRTEITLVDDDKDRTVDINVQPRSTITLQGARIDVLEDSQLNATAGRIVATAQASWAGPFNAETGIPPEITSTPDASRIFIADGARLDVAGAEIALPVERNLIRVELRGSQLANSPQQRDGALRGQAVTIDVRDSGTRPDGTTWQGTPVGDVSGDISTIARTVAERSLGGGSISLVTQGDLVIGGGATLDVSGGAIRYQDGFIQTSQVLGADGRVYDISDADPNRVYVGVVDSYSRTDERWGVVQTFPGFPSGAGRFEAGYVEGKDAGSVTLIAPRVVVDGSIAAHTVAGRYQRRPAVGSPNANGNRPYDQYPRGGSLSVGNANPELIQDFVLGGLEFRGGAILPDLLNEDGRPFDPRRDRLADEYGDLRLDPAMLAEGGVDRIRADVNGSITLPAGPGLQLRPGATVTLNGNAVTIDAAIVSAGGRVNLNGRGQFDPTGVLPGGLLLTSNALLNLAGRWTNDLQSASQPVAPDAFAIDGGAATLASGSIRIEPGALIDLSGGARIDSAGARSFGSAGSLSLSGPTQVDDGNSGSGLLPTGSVRAYGFERGGTLRITAPAICVASGDCSFAGEAPLVLSPQELEAGGFENILLTADLGGLRIAAGTVIAPRLQNLVFTGDATTIATGTPIDQITSLTLRPVEQRRPVNLSLASTYAVVPGEEVSSATFLSTPDLVVESGAAVLGDVRAAISLSSTTRMLVDGTLSAPSGTISLGLDASLRVSEFVAAQGIWLGANARLDAAGTSLVRTGDDGLRSGQVLPGGSVTIRTTRGYIVANPGSVIDLAGARDEIDLPTGSLATRSSASTVVASAGGQLNLLAAEGMLLGGTFRLQSGLPGSVAGGQLAVTIDATQRNDPGIFTHIFPANRREVRLEDTVAPTLVEYGTAVPDALNGRATLAAEDIRASGADFLSLTATNLRRRVEGTDNILAAPGAIVFDGDVALAPTAGLFLQAAELESTGGAARIDTAYLVVGQSNPLEQLAADTLLRGTGSLQVNAGLLEFIGNSAASGFETVTLASTGDIRARGVQADRNFEISGQFTTAADLLLQAQQIYPSTLTRFSFQSVATADALGRIETRPVAGTAAPVLSVGGSLRLVADEVLHGGTLQAPLGTVAIVADRAILLPTSRTSTTAQGLTIPYGTTQGGFDWVYELPGGGTFVYGASERPLPAQRVEFDARQIDIRDGAQIDVRGGGDLLAYEFVSGPRGTVDVLSSNRANQFAIVPGLDLGYAPYDPAISPGFSTPFGSSLYLPTGTGDLPAGTYALLPARYALLPGAFLVTATSGYSDLPAGNAIRQLDGTTVVAGFRTIAGTNLRESRSSGYSIRQGAAIGELAQYDLSLASKFFAAGGAGADYQGRRPADAGTLALLPRESLVFAGQTLGTPATGGRGVLAEIAADRLVVTSDPDAAVPGAVVIAPLALAALQAESVLLGGRTRLSDDGERIELEALADSVEIASGTQLTFPEIVLLANGELIVGDEAELIADGKAQSGLGAVSLPGDAALLRLAAGDLQSVERVATGGAGGTIDIRPGSLLRTSGSAQFDAIGTIRLDGRLELDGAALAIAVPSIALGSAPADAADLVLAGSLLDALALRELRLAATGGLSVFGSVNLAATSLTLIAPTLSATGEDSSLALRAAEEIALIGTYTGDDVRREAPAAFAGAALTLEGERIDLAGRVLAAGFGATALRSRSDIVLVDDGELAASGDLQLASARIRGARAIDFALRARGALAANGLTGIAAGTAADASLPGVGVRLDIEAVSVEVDTSIDLPSGVLAIAADGDIGFGARSRIDLSAPDSRFDGIAIGAPGGLLQASSRDGSITLAADSLIDLSAENGEEATAGILELAAARGTIALGGRLLGQGPTADRSGRALIDARQVGDWGLVTSALNAGGFFAERSIRQRGPGDLVLAAGETAVAQRFTAIADGGDIRVLGQIDARGEAGGTVRLYARDTVFIAGSVLASANGAGAQGGRVEIGATQGLVLAAGSTVDVAGRGEGSSAAGVRDDGEVFLRTERTTLLALLDQDPTNDRVEIQGTVRGAGSLVVEGNATYRSLSGVIDAALTNPDASNSLFADAAAFQARSAALQEALGLGAVDVVAGITVEHAGDLQLASDWNLADWRFGGTAGVLTLRATGNLLVDASLSDGFSDPQGFTLSRDPTSWSYRIVAGADLAGADPLGIGSQAWSAPLDGSAQVRLGPGPVAVRTGTGRIEIAAGGDVVLGDQRSVIYTAGVRSEEGILLSAAGGLRSLPYPVNGGDIVIDARGSIIGARSNQMVTDWLWRQGQAPTEPRPAATGWTVNFQRFQQNVAALGGGDVSIRAGRDIRDLSVSIPTVGIQVGGTSAAASEVVVTGEGRLDVRAAGSIDGGAFYVGRGSGQIAAADTIGGTPAISGGAPGFAPVLALGDATYSIRSRDDLTIAGVLNPTLLPQGASQGTNVSSRSYFSTYSADSRVSMVTAGGDLLIENNEQAGPETLFAQWSSMNFATGTFVIRLFAPTLRAAAVSGDLQVGGNLSLYPSPVGGLELLAGGNLVLGSREGVFQTILSDADVSVLPTLDLPRNTLNGLIFQDAATNSQAGFNSRVPVHSAASRPDGMTDRVPVRLVTATGDISVVSQSVSAAGGLLYSAKPVRVVAGRDVRDLGLFVQHLDRASVSSVIAGRDIVYSVGRDEVGGIESSALEMIAAGPGRLQLMAGGSIDLQTSTGISSIGNLRNLALPDEGASISALAGLGAAAPDYAAFTQAYLIDSDDYDAALLTYMNSIRGVPVQTRSEALAEFAVLSSEEQRGLLEAILFAELRAGGREAAAAGAGNGDFTRAFAALETMFPGSNPDVDAGEANAYDGDIRMFFSRIYTLDDGDIALLAPGGEVNVGLASPPTAFGINKAASQLGVVAQRSGSIASVSYADFQVNESRVFAADGGDILVWSTRGDIDAGRGAKTAISAPPPTITFDENGRAIVSFPAALTGSGIQTLATSAGREAGDVDLFAPRGIVNAGDAGIVAGNLTIAATAVLGADNIQFSGVAVGVPVDTGGAGLAVTAASSVASSAAAAADTVVGGDRSREQEETSAADDALSWLDVFVIGLGDESCDPKDLECLRRQKKQ